MSSSDPNLDQQVVIDRVCDDFESQWKRDASPPDLREFLTRANAKSESALAYELILLDRHYRRENGLSTTQVDYNQHFPDLVNVIERAFSDGAKSLRTDQTVDGAPLATIDSAATLSPIEPHLIGKRIRYFGDYELIDEIARGGMGVVYRAKQLSLNRVIALKMILSGQIAGEDQVRRFQLEAEAAANLDHPGIVPIYDIGQHEGQHYFSMKLIEGKTLSQMGPELQADHGRAIETMAKIADAIHHAHQRGILHRDLKPGNVLIDEDGQPLITDFGLARDTKSDQQHTASGAVIGTPGFMSPEQAAGKGVTTATDIYSLGAILYQLIAGRPPHQGDTVMATLMSVMNDEPPKPRSIDAEIDSDLELICLKCLDKDPDRRYASAAEFAGDLRAHAAGEPLRARAPSIVELARMWLAGNYGSVVWVPVIAIVVGVISGLALWFSTVGHDVAANVGIFDAFPQSEKPWMAIGYSKNTAQAAALLLIGMVTTIGWFTAKWVRTKNAAADFGAGLSVGLLAGLIAFVSGFGIPLIVTSQRATNEDLALVRKLVLYENEAQSHQEIIAHYPSLAELSNDQRKRMLMQKLLADYPLGMLMGIWTGTAVSLLFFGLLGVIQTCVAGPLIRNQSPWGARLRYLAFTAALTAFGFILFAESYSRFVIGAGMILDWGLPITAVTVCVVAMVSVVRRWVWPVQLVTTVIGVGLFLMFFFGELNVVPSVPIQRAKIAAGERKLAAQPDRRDLAVSLANSHADYADVLERRGRVDHAIEHYLKSNEILQSWFYDDKQIAVRGQWNHVEINLIARVYYRIAELALKLKRPNLAAEMMNESTSLISSGLDTINLYAKSVFAADKPAIEFVHVPDNNIGRWWRVREQVRALAAARSDEGDDAETWLTTLVDELLVRSDAATTDSAWPKLRPQIREALLCRQHWQLFGPFPRPPNSTSEQIFEQPFGPETALVKDIESDIPTPDAEATVYPGQPVWLSDVLADVEGVIGYARATIDIDEAVKVKFLMGSNDGNKVWIDGKLVHSNDVYRDVHPESDNFDVELDRGKHELVIKITQGTSAWGFAIDARDPRGVPLPIWTSATDTSEDSE